MRYSISMLKRVLSPWSEVVFAALRVVVGFMFSLHGVQKVVCGWGKLAGPERSRDVLALIRGVGVTPHALRLNRDGSPAHPLYLPAKLVPVAMGDSNA